MRFENTMYQYLLEKSENTKLKILFKLPNQFVIMNDMALIKIIYSENRLALFNKEEFILLLSSLQRLFNNWHNYNILCNNGKINYPRDLDITRQNFFVPNIIYNRHSTCRKYLNLKKHFHLQECYIYIQNDYSFHQNYIIKLLQKIKQLERTSNILIDSANNCKGCISFQRKMCIFNQEYSIITKKCSDSLAEKEKMVMKYATSEKHLIEARRLIKCLEKKNEHLVKETVDLKLKNSKVRDETLKLKSEISCKTSLISELYSQIKRYEETDKAKDIKLKWTKHNLKNIHDEYEKVQSKLQEALTRITQLMKERENLGINDAQSKTENALNCMDNITAEYKEKSLLQLQIDLNGLAEKQHLSNKENHLLISQIRALKDECTDYKSKFEVVNAALLKENREVYSLKCHLAEAESLQNRLENNEIRFTAMETDLKRHLIEKSELQSEVEAYRKREIQLLDFTQKLTDKNVQLQCDLSNLQSKVHLLEKSHFPMQRQIDQLMINIKNTECDLSTERIKRKHDTEILAKYTAEQVIYQKKIINHIENLEGENNLLRKKYELSVRELTRELHCYHKKLNERFIDVTV